MNLKNKIGNGNSNYFEIQVMKCNQNSLPEGETCASVEEVERYFTNTVFNLFEVKNFIDFNKVDDEPVQRMS